jgi:hypothetical protein
VARSGGARTRHRWRRLGHMRGSGLLPFIGALRGAALAWRPRTAGGGMAMACLGRWALVGLAARPARAGQSGSGLRARSVPVG